MPAADLADVESVVRTIATVAVDNEKYFGDLDAVVGDGDFGYSMARGFELVLSGWDDFDRTDIGTFLKKIAVVITSRIGGTSGPDLGDRLPARRAAPPGPPTGWSPPRSSRCCGPRSRASRPAGSRTWGTRPCWMRWCPRWTRSRSGSAPETSAAAALRAAAPVARERAEATRSMQAMRGRASYTGERSIGTLDAGAVAVAVMFEALADQWGERERRILTHQSFWRSKS